MTKSQQVSCPMCDQLVTKKNIRRHINRHDYCHDCQRVVKRNAHKCTKLRWRWVALTDENGYLTGNFIPTATTNSISPPTRQLPPLPRLETTLEQVLELYKVIIELRKQKCDCTMFNFLGLPCNEDGGCRTSFEQTINLYSIEAFATCGILYTDYANVKLNLKKIFDIHSPSIVQSVCENDHVVEG